MSQSPLSSAVRTYGSTWQMVVAGVLLMGMGWGIRGAYGHCFGAMMPGALLGLTVAVCSGRGDWHRRAAVCGLAAAIGWGFGGQSSYGILIGYTTAPTLENSLYGYATLFLVGGIWSGIGGGILGLALTERRSFLDQFIGPLLAMQISWYAAFWIGDLLVESGLVPAGFYMFDPGDWLYDSVWLKAWLAAAVAAAYGMIVPGAKQACRLIVVLSLGWWAGMIALPGLLSLRINPPRNDSWAGALGIFVALAVYLSVIRNRAARMLACYGLLAGGVGFSVGAFFQMLGKAKWGPIGQLAVLQEFNYWTVMEMTLGALMGLGITLGARRLIQHGLAAPREDKPAGWLNEFAAFVLLVHVMWVNFSQDIPVWVKKGKAQTVYLGLSAHTWFVIYATLLAGLLLYALYRRRTVGLPLLSAMPLGQGQLLCLLTLWMVVVGYFSSTRVHAVNMTVYIIASAASSLIFLSQRPTQHQQPVDAMAARGADYVTWNVGWRYWALWPVAVVLLVDLAWFTMQLELKPIHIRFL